MAIIKQVTAETLYMGKLQHNADLLAEITDICIQHDIQLGRIEALGAVKRACLGFYNQSSFEYQFFNLDQPLEITNLVGNISIKDKKPMIHAHITLTDEAGKAYGGHLAPGTIIFACEIMIQVFNGPVFERGFDQETKLPLWSMQ